MTVGRESQSPMNKLFGCQSMADRLRRVIVKPPDESFCVANPEEWHYTGRPDLEKARREHDAFTAVIREAGAEVIYHDEFQPGLADAIYVHDTCIVTDKGAVILRMGKAQRRGEEEAMARLLERLGVPILHRLCGEATAEGGDLLWVDRETLAVGRGFRTNAEGIRQLNEALTGSGISIIPVDLPYFQGPQACLHLMSLISIVDKDLAVVYSRLMSVAFRQFLIDRGVRLVEVPDEEFPTMGPNVLALGPRDCVLLEGNPITRRRLEEAGCRVQTYSGEEISHKAEGGPTCLTKPILRD